MLRRKDIKYFLVRVYTFTNWVVDFPYQTEKVVEVIRVLLSETIPRFRLPKCLHCDNSSSFKAAVTQVVSKSLRSYVVSSSLSLETPGKVGKAYDILNRQLGNLSKKIHLSWIIVLPKL